MKALKIDFKEWTRRRRKFQNRTNRRPVTRTRRRNRRLVPMKEYKR